MANKTYADRGRIEFGAGIETPQPEEPTKSEREGELKQVLLEGIGTPDNLFKVDVKELHDTNHYRINVYLEHKGRLSMTDSSYVVITPEGVTFSPPLKKKYYDADLALISSSKAD